MRARTESGREVKRALASFEKRYCRALVGCIDSDADEERMAAALELGRAALTQGHSLLDLLSTHHGSLASVIGRPKKEAEFKRRHTRAQEFLTQVLMPFEMVSRGWREITARLSQTNAVLEEKVAERTASLRAREQQLESISAHVPGLVYQRVLRPDGSVTYPFISGSFLADLGEAREEALRGRISLLDFTHPDDRDKWAAAIERSAMELSPIDMELRIVLPSGDVRWMMSHSRPRQESDGSIIWDAVAVDTTERRLIQQQLVQAQKMEAIGTLTGGMSHDFNNLLGVIIGNLDLLEEVPQDNLWALELQKNALAAALRGAELTRRLLAFARRQPLQPKKVEINTLVSNLTELLNRTLGEDIEIDLKLEPDLWPVIADPAQIESAIMNLAANARDAMPKGGRLSIATRNAQLDAEYTALHADVSIGDYALIEISDGGSGIPPDILHRIFEPFFTTKEEGRGTGLGLSMVFGFMKQSGGHVNVYSEPGVGTTFRLYLPRGQHDIVEEVRVAPKVIHAVGGETILVVEDNAAVREVVVRQLIGAGYEVIEAENARTALAILHKRKTIALLFTDVVMPDGMDGKELVRAATALRPRLRVLFTSGFPEEKFTERDSGALGFRLLSKPYRKKDLLQVVREVIDG